MNVAQVGDSSVIAAVGPFAQDDTLLFYYQPIGGKWAPSEPVSGLNNVSSASIAQVGNSSVIAAVNKDGSLWYAWQIIGGRGWNLESVAPAGSVAV